MTKLNEKQIEAAKKIGNEWTGGKHRRIYINDIYERYCRLYDFKADFYKSGNVSSATENGEKITNSRASGIISDVTDIKIYVDLNTGKINAEFIDGWDDEVEELIKDIVAEITAKPEKITPEPEPKEKFEVQVNFYSNFENRPASVTPKFVAHKMDFNTPRDFPELIIGGSFEEVMEAAKNKWGDLPHCKITCECPGCTRKEIKYIVPGASELEINNAVSELRKQYPDYDIFVTSDEEDVLGPVQYSELWTGAYFFTSNQDDWDAIEKFAIELFRNYRNF